MRDRNPCLWLMTDERIDERLIRAILRLPPGSGIVFRHLATPRGDRVALFRRIRAIAVARRLTLVSVDGLLGSDRHGGPRAITAPAHSRREAIRHRHARWLFVSPIHPTRSHPGDPALGVMSAARIARGLETTVIALGGMTASRWRKIRHLGFDGWAAIDGLVGR